MADMLVKNDISGVRLLNICKEQLVEETATDVLGIVYNLIIPKIILHYIPFDNFFKSHKDLFDMCLDKVLTDGKITDETTRQLVVNAMIGSAKNDQDILKLKQWFKEEKITNSAGKILDIKVTVGLKHAFIKRIWSTSEISLAEKQSLLDDLEKLDKSDRFEKT